MTEAAKDKGNLLEKIVSRICSGITDAKSESNVKVLGTSGVMRQIDTLVTGTIGTFEIKILVDSKNHAAPIDINEVESLAGMVLDVGANLGVIVCPSGFTEGAKKRADSAGIQLYEIYDESLGNTNLFIPLRYIEARIDKYSFQFSGTSAAGPFSIPTDASRWQLHIDGKQMEPEDVPVYLWNEDKIPQKKGEYPVKVGAVKITDTQDKNKVQYCDLTLHVIVVEDYYLKLFPASFLRKTGEQGKEHFDLRIDVYSKKEDMLKNGWKSFDTLEEMNTAADIENQPSGVRELLIRNFYSIGEKPTTAVV
jgi:Restriction endonuclease